MLHRVYKDNSIRESHRADNPGQRRSQSFEDQMLNFIVKTINY